MTRLNLTWVPFGPFISPQCMELRRSLELEAAPTVSVKGVTLTLALVLAGFAALPFDLQVGLWSCWEQCPRPIRQYLELFEAVSHGFGVLTILVTIFVVDVSKRRMLPRVFWSAVTAGLLANFGKLMLARSRPPGADFSGPVWSTFGEWFPLTSAGHSFQSFPSAHAATAFGFAVALGWLYPRGRVLFFAFAAFGSAQRVVHYAHFLSDTFWGAAIGYATGMAYLHWPKLAEVFHRFEQPANQAGQATASGGSAPVSSRPLIATARASS